MVGGGSQLRPAGLGMRPTARLRRVAMARSAVPVWIRGGVLGERHVSDVVQGFDGPVPAGQGGELGGLPGAETHPANVLRAPGRLVQTVLWEASTSAPFYCPAMPGAEEMRVALVMNGGVSLAVWMGGVTHELDLLRRASFAQPGEEGTGSDKRVFAIWKQIAEEANTRVLIDIVSGTSAGGLNGMLLATALGRGTALPPLRAVWEETASL